MLDGYTVRLAKKGMNDIIQEGLIFLMQLTNCSTRAAAAFTVQQGA